MKIKLVVAIPDMSQIKEAVEQIKKSEITNSHPNVEIIIEVGKDVNNQSILST